MSSRALRLAQEGSTESMTLSLVGALGAVLLINLILSGDNAVVIGMAVAVRGLPPRLQQRAISIGSRLAVVVRLGLTIRPGCCSSYHSCTRAAEHCSPGSRIAC